MFKNLVERWNNFKLWIKYPFIRPRSVSNDKYCSNFFNYTYLSFIPKGWVKAFGNQLCEDLNNALKCYDKNIRKSFRIHDIKEKHGRLQISCNWYTLEVNAVLNKYEKISHKTCIICGSKAYWYTKGYSPLPMCNHCKRDHTFEYKFDSIYRKNKKRRNKRG